jgi:gamma-glutamyltranspeptidase/glutathione hydrolase
MSPTIVLKDGHPVFSVGAAGGPTIISQTLLAIICTIDFRMPIEKALAAPRFHHQWRPDELRIEKKIGNSTIEELRKRGHNVLPVEHFGACQAIAFDPARRIFTGVADPRNEGKAIGW